MVRRHLAVLAISIIGIPAVQADGTVMLRCDLTGYGAEPRSATEPIVMEVDLAKRRVHVGKKDDVGWYVDGRDLPQQTGDQTKWHGIVNRDCTYNRKQYVEVTEKQIRMGARKKATNICGDGNRSMREETTVDWSIDRITGVADADDGDYWSKERWKYQCQPLTEKAF